jgi:hypothetical protein
MKIALLNRGDLSNGQLPLLYVLMCQSDRSQEVLAYTNFFLLQPILLDGVSVYITDLNGT